MGRQMDWRPCGACAGLHFDGASRKGECAAGIRHQPVGLNFGLPFGTPETPTAQAGWRACGKCLAMFFDGDHDKGVCPSGGGHRAEGAFFVLPHDVPPSPVAEARWRFCLKCMGLVFDGDPARRGRCPAGDAHAPAGFDFVLPHIGVARISTRGIGTVVVGRSTSAGGSAPGDRTAGSR
jgi:hypothetical protein